MTLDARAIKVTFKEQVYWLYQKGPGLVGTVVGGLFAPEFFDEKAQRPLSRNAADSFAWLEPGDGIYRFGERIGNIDDVVPYAD